jgi:curved DNA-binding protein CbpA
MSDFLDYYEILEISPNAGSETIERMFRYLARRYHPDNHSTADRDRFDLVLEAHSMLRDPVSRVRYDIQYKQHLGFRSELIEEANDNDGVNRDVHIQNKMLSLLYVKRRRKLDDPGLGELELERLLGCPLDHMRFHLWYMREKKWISRTEIGTFAITVEGIDYASFDSQNKAGRKLLTDQS